MSTAHRTEDGTHAPHAAVPPALRARLHDDPGLGTGNFLDRVRAVHPAADRPFVWAVPSGGGPEAAQAWSLDRITAARDALAAWYHGAGVSKGVPVAVQMGDGFGYFLHFLALSSLGAVPALVNGGMPAAVAADYIRRTGAAGVVADTPRLEALRAAGLRAGPGMFLQEAGALPLERSPGDRLPGVFPYPHADTDPVMLCHTSGTTGAPKAATFAHRQFFLGKRERLVSFPAPEDGNRLLSALPQSHSAGISYLMTATLLGLPTMVLSDPGGPSAVAAMRAFAPTVVAAFPQTWVDLAGTDLDGAADRVHTWINTGDSAHEAHVRALVRYGRRPEGGGFRPGSRFIDGLGSSEMGMALFRKVSDPETDDYGRCVGVPIGVVEEVAVLDGDGRPVEDGRPGRLGVRTPTVTPGYWNDSGRTALSSFSGYWLTGDVVYRDTDGRIYHLDRVPDVVHTADGPVFSLPLEEVVLSEPGVADCAVVAVPDPGTGAMAPYAVVRPAEGAEPPADLLGALNARLEAAGLARLRGASAVRSEEDFPLGPTGKVLKRRLRERFADALGGPVGSPA
ncbi:class I adenylate-forming enzyme family protein [Nocardiopsis sp. RSe5-2]|uniref:Class I adenylate-forming enzyme family protein n=1 Tax=Nocardiopsis endophytica TaxID=3018445 RepID=A0ABT4U3B0_9ACTN|nr:class I adenylate-forming enzyme family protein [Nocardiopsis endophytica]MDA2811420.1 class I adenylate-forming enzyme family protein [Nocardiopsis endophytica]